MALLERVATLLRANFNDLIDRAEDPEKMLKQLVLDMENQLLQLKTQVAISIADEHMLERKKLEHEALAAQWSAKAETAAARGRDDMARQALERSLAESTAAGAFAVQLEAQQAQAAALRNSYLRLQAKLSETNTRCATLSAEHRRARTGRRAIEVSSMPSAARTLGRSTDQVRAEQARGYAQMVLDAPTLEERFEEMERNDQVEALLAQLKSQQVLGA